MELVLAKRESTPTSSVGTFTLFQHRVQAGAGSRRVQIIVSNADERRQVFDQVRAVWAEETVSFPWAEGDVLMLDNMLVAHARRPFEGPRKVVVAMAEPHGNLARDAAPASHPAAQAAPV